MKTRTTLTVLLCLSFIIAIAQQNSPSVNKNKVVPVLENENPSSTGGGSSARIMSSYNLGDECSMYMNEDFQKGILTLKDKTIFEDRLYRFNIYNQQMEFILNDDTAAIGNPEELQLLHFDGKDFIFAEYQSDEKVNNAYMELLVDGDYQLLLFSYIKYTSRENVEDPKDQPDVIYYLETEYYVAFKNDPAKPILLNKKEVINTLQVPGKDIKQYMKNSHNQMKTQADLLDVFEYCNAPIQRKS